MLPFLLNFLCKQRDNFPALHVTHVRRSLLSSCSQCHPLVHRSCICRGRGNANIRQSHLDLSRRNRTAVARVLILCNRFRCMVATDTISELKLVLIGRRRNNFFYPCCVGSYMKSVIKRNMESIHQKSKGYETPWKRHLTLPQATWVNITTAHGSLPVRKVSPWW